MISFLETLQPLKYSNCRDFLTKNRGISIFLCLSKFENLEKQIADIPKYGSIIFPFGIAFCFLPGLPTIPDKFVNSQSKFHSRMAVDFTLKKQE